MAATITNKGKHSILAAYVASNPDLRMGLLKTLASHANVPDINFIADMEAHADFAELTVAGYARIALTGEAAAEDDTNDRAAIDSDSATTGNLAVGETIVGGFFYEHTGSDATAKVIVIFDLASTPTNGGAATVNIVDILRAS